MSICRVIINWIAGALAINARPFVMTPPTHEETGPDWQEPKWRGSSGSTAGRNVLSTPRRRNPSCGDCRRLAVTMSASQPLGPLRVAGFEQFCSHEEAVLSSLLQRSRRSRPQVHRRFDPIVLFSIGDRGGIHNSMIPGLARRTSEQHEILLGGASDLYSNGEPQILSCAAAFPPFAARHFAQLAGYLRLRHSRTER